MTDSTPDKTPDKTPENPFDDDVAKKRWTILQLLRFGGAFTVLLGIVIISGRGIDLPELGYVMVLAGAIGFFVLPVSLAKRWKSPDQ